MQCTNRIGDVSNSRDELCAGRQRAHLRRTPETCSVCRGGTNYGKLGGQSIIAAASAIPVYPLLLEHMTFFALQ